MSNETRLYGYIEVPRWKGWDDAMRFNLEAIGRLPVEGKWPWLIRDMFAVAPERVAYRNWLIHFAADVKGLDEGWALWIKKFEKLLGSMRWFSVVLHLETENNGCHWFIWTADEKSLEEDRTIEWSLISGPDGTDESYGSPLREFPPGNESQ